MTRCGFVALFGKTNSGKSTFLNTIIDEKVSIVSPKAQTTQKLIKGIYTDARMQVIFLDTPGMYIGNKKDDYEEYARLGVNQSDLVLHFIDSSKKPGNEEQKAQEILDLYKKPVLTVYSKTDISIRDIPKNALKISSVDRQGFDSILDMIYKHLPEGPFLYPEDVYTEQDIDMRISEIVREKIFVHFREELPYKIHVNVDDIEETDTSIRVGVGLTVDSDSQRKIVIGHKGTNLSLLGVEARSDLEDIFDKKIHLILRVKLANPKTPQYDTKSRL